MRGAAVVPCAVALVGVIGCAARSAPATPADAAVPASTFAAADSLRVRLRGEAGPRAVRSIERAGPDSLAFVAREGAERRARPWSAVERIEAGVVRPMDPMRAGRRAAWKVAPVLAVAGALLGQRQGRPATGAALGGIAGYWLGFVFGGQSADPLVGRRETVWRTVYRRS